MPFSMHLFCVIVLLIPTVLRAERQPHRAAERSRQMLRQVAWAYNWPGGALFHTAFQRGFTTRLLLLKACLRSPVLAEHLDLTEAHLESIRQLEPAVLDPPGNAQPDEQTIDADYFSFLSEEQLRKLDMTALRYDGYCALTRQSMAKSAELSDESLARINDFVEDVREEIILPQFRWEFAAQLPEDYSHQKTWFAGSVTTYVNIEIVGLMTDGECERFARLMAQHALPRDVEDELRKLMTLPGGVRSLPVNGGEDEADR